MAENPAAGPAVITIPVEGQIHVKIRADELKMKLGT